MNFACSIVVLAGAVTLAATDGGRPADILPRTAAVPGGVVLLAVVTAAATLAVTTATFAVQLRRWRLADARLEAAMTAETP